MTGLLHNPHPFDHEKYLTKMCDYKGTTKNGQMKTTYLIEVVVLHAAGDAK